jgi:hypothetical protein
MSATSHRIWQPAPGKVGAGSFDAPSPRCVVLRPCHLSHVCQRSPGNLWRKALYVKQQFEDNHVPDSFLQELVTNGTLVMHTDPNRWGREMQCMRHRVRCCSLWFVLRSWSGPPQPR